MKNFPSKLIPVKDSILISMLKIVKLIPTDGISCIQLQNSVSHTMDVVEFVEAMTNLYAISYISMDNNQIIRKIC